MSDQQGDNKELETNSPPDDTGKTIVSTTLLDLAPELILRIASLLEVRELLTLRRCHRLLYSISQDKLLWRRILRDLNLPLPRVLRFGSLDGLSCSELEGVVRQSYVVEKRWLVRRETSLELPLPNESSLLRFLDDQWIISIPETGLPTIWDARESPPKRCKFHGSASSFFEARIYDHEVAVDPRQGDIIIWLRRSPQEQSWQHILRVHLTDADTNSLQITAHQITEDLDPGVIALEPSRNLVIVDDRGCLRVCDWIRDRTVQIRALVPDDDDRSGEILSVRLVGGHIITFRDRCMELVSIPPFSDTGGRTFEADPILHRFHWNTNDLDDVFAGASLSEPQPNPESPNESLIVYALARRWKAVCYFRIVVYNPDYAPSGPKARMDVSLLGEYETKHLDAIRGRCRISGIQLGTEGKRGIWIEWSGAHVRCMVVASFDQSCSGAVVVQSGDDLRELCRIAPRIESTCDAFAAKYIRRGAALYSFSEATGKTVLMMEDDRTLAVL